MPVYDHNNAYRVTSKDLPITPEVTHVLWDDVTINASTQSVWVDIRDALDFLVELNVQNAAGTLAGEFAIEVAGPEKISPSRIVWADGDAFEAVVSATDLLHVFDVSGSAAAYFRLTYTAGSGASETNGVRATYIIKRVRR